MKAHAEKQSKPQQPASHNITRSGAKPLATSHVVHPLLHLQRMIGNQAVQRLLQPNADALEADSVASAKTRFAPDFSRIPVSREASVKLQAKLRVNTPGDIYEQEADRLSERVMSMAEPRLQRTCACGGGCPTCRNEQVAHERLQTKRVEANDSGGLAAPPIVNEVLHSSGQPLDPSTRAFMEPRFGHDFSRVRVHTDARAAESARAVNALAYSVGRDVVFGLGHYRPASIEGRKLLAHELTHVLQQGSGGRLEEGVLNAGGPSHEAAAQILPNWIARRVTPQASHVIARMSSGEETPTAMSETPDSEAGNEAMPSDASGLGVAVTLKEFITSGTPKTNVAAECVQDKRVPYAIGIGLEGRARHGMEMVFGLSAIPKNVTFDFDQQILESFAWQRVPKPAESSSKTQGSAPKPKEAQDKSKVVEEWEVLNYEAGPDNSPHQKCVTPNDNKEIFKWDQVGISRADVAGQELLGMTVSAKASGVIVRTNFRTTVRGKKGEGSEKDLYSVEWHSINSAAPEWYLTKSAIPKDPLAPAANDWKIDKSQPNEIAQTLTDVSKP